MRKPISSSAILFLAAILLALMCLPVSSLAEEPLHWTGPVNVSQTLSDSEGPVIVFGDDGKTHVIWEEQSVLVHSYLDGDIWTAPLPFFAGTSPAACTEGSAVHLVWVDEVEGVQQILYAGWTAGNWTPPVNVSCTDGDSTSPAIAMTPGGRLHVVWSDDTPGYWSIYHAHSNDGVLWAVGPIPSGAGQAPCIDVDVQGVAHVAWHDRFLPEDPYHVYYSCQDGEDWSWPVDVSDSPDAATYPGILVDPAGETHLVWGEIVGGVSIVRHSMTGLGGYWTLPVDISSAGMDSWAPRLVLRADGRVAAAWNETDRLSFRSRAATGGAWLPRSTIVGGTAEINEVVIAAGLDEDIHAAWSAPGDAGKEVYYSRGGAAEDLESRIFLPLVLRGL